MISSFHYSRVLWLSCPLGFIYANFNAQVELMECLPLNMVYGRARVMCYNGKTLLIDRRGWVVFNSCYLYWIGDIKLVY